MICSKFKLLMLNFSKDPCYDKLETSKCEAKEANGKCYDVTKWNDVRFVRRHCKSTCGICGKSEIGCKHLQIV